MHKNEAGLSAPLSSSVPGFNDGEGTGVGASLEGDVGENVGVRLGLDVGVGRCVSPEPEPGVGDRVGLGLGVDACVGLGVAG